eukprot:3377493-Rhodomonas_salina.2
MPGTDVARMLLPGAIARSRVGPAGCRWYSPLSSYARAMRCAVLTLPRPTRYPVLTLPMVCASR